MSASVLALAARAAQAAPLLGAAALVVSVLGPAEQGLFFVFLSLGTLVQLGEFGLGYVLLQTASHLGADGDRGRLGAFARQARGSGVKLLTASAFGVGALGVAMLQSGADAGAVLPWLAYATVVAGGHAVNLWLLYVEGARSVRRAWRIRLAQEVIGGAIFLAALGGGAGLWSLALYAAARGVVGGLGLVATSSRDRTQSVPGAFRWREEAWPFQWRVGLSAFAGFLVFQAVNPVLLLEQGSEAAGRFGLSLAMMNMLLLVCGAWPLSQAASYGHALAVNDMSGLRRRFYRTLVGSTALAAVLALGVVGMQALLALAGSPVVARMADLPTTAALMACAVLNHGVAAIAVLLRAERREPLLALSVVGGALTLTAVWLAARQGSLLAPALACAAMALLGVCWVFVHYRAFAARVFTSEAA